MRTVKRFLRWLRRSPLALACGHDMLEGGYVSCDGCHQLLCQRCLAQHITEHYPITADQAS